MRLIDLFEKEIRGAVVKPGTYDTLYHLTDYQGFSVSVNKNSLNAFRQNYISTTWDESMNSVGGRDHYHFKFLLNGDKCLSEFPANRHKSYAQYTDGSGHHDWDEREVALQTQSIAPLQDYLTGLAIIIPIYSRSFIQWMFYEIREWNSLMGGKVTDSAPKGIESLRVVFKDWGVPLYRSENGKLRPLTQKEKLFINDCFGLIHKGITFKNALITLVDKYPEEIDDHMRDKMTPAGLSMEQLAPKYIKRINKAIGEKDIYRMNTNSVRKVVKGMFEDLKYSTDDVHRLMKACEENQLFHPMMEPLWWSIIIRNLVNNRSVNAIIDNIGYIAQHKLGPQIQHWWDDGKRPRWGTKRHYKAFDGGGSLGRS